MEDRHIVEVAGCRAVIEHGKVTHISDPLILFCPFAKRFAQPINPVMTDMVKKNIEHRVSAFGMCTPDRQVLASESMVLFGASELLTTALRLGRIDAVVICCDGAGTVIVRTPELLQGIGGRMSGLVSTVPYPSVIDRIETAGGIVIDKDLATLDPVAGVSEAYNRGYARIAVTVAGRDVGIAETIRNTWPETTIIAVHTSFIETQSEADRLFAACDLIYACASKYIRSAAAEHACVQGGVGVPVFAASRKGKQIVLDRLMEMEEPFVVKNMHLPVCDMGKQPDPLV